MSWAVIASIVLHVGLLVFAYVGVEHRSEQLIVEESPVFVDIVPLDETSNPPPPSVTPPEEVQPEPPPEPEVAALEPDKPPAPEITEPEAAPEPDISDSEPLPEAEPEPVQEIEEPQVEPETVEPEPLPEAETIEPEPEKEIAALPPPETPADPDPQPSEEESTIPAALLSLKPKAKPAPPSPPTDFASVMDTVSDLANESEPKPEVPAPAQTRPSTARNDASRPVTMTEVDLVRRQIEQCWNVPAGAKNAENMAVAVRVDMNPDGTPRAVSIEDNARMQTDPYFRAAAESAKRAVLNPRCHPFKLPPDKYQRWQTMTVIFDPKEMFGT
jgi:hypothetical protein